ncbi:MAG: methylated-DNA--[protein]-cysteine S-methyltransferase [Pseudomonadota bacterium]
MTEAATGTRMMCSPFGDVGVVERDGAIVKLIWSGEDGGETTAVANEAIRQLQAYFDGELTSFDLPLAPNGTPFQQQVYAEMQAIPLGQTKTYGAIADNLDVPPQPVGQACGSNPIPIIIPCHRVVGMDGLGGFSAPGGVETKVKLLKFEGAYSLLL